MTPRSVYTFTPKTGYLITGAGNITGQERPEVQVRTIIRPKEKFLLQVHTLESIDPSKHLLAPLLKKLSEDDESNVHRLTFSVYDGDSDYPDIAHAVIGNEGGVVYKSDRVNLLKNGTPNLRTLRTEWEVNVTNNPHLIGKKGMSLEDFLGLYNSIFPGDLPTSNTQEKVGKDNCLDSFDFYLNHAQDANTRWDVLLSYSEAGSGIIQGAAGILRIFTPFSKSRSGRQKPIEEMVAHLGMYLNPFINLQTPEGKFPEVMNDEEYAKLQAKRGQ